ncbi:indole-3-glycerol phosphate synthase TrpC [Parvularcula sp. ZS-1/3]|uniref:Indole-3-glycerol phosphate synthase n=1 Tax=Parvularcula mediterranea TaxID=2732508 RepID=A0A7Y3RQW4_9PROT|nr:indole-3-glycerol phosphate synthase TrpC [Parvularcula mediterranea]NNU17727.1 indole-3-glycerol phosphate synthase TrpC [Parvularcula mediterranea]
MSTVLDKIIAYKKDEVAAAKERAHLSTVEERARGYTPRGFAAALEAKAAAGVGIIAEVKRASPSKGLIREDFRPAELAASLERGGAACLSVLTDRPSFQGHIDFLTQARSATTIPLLRKDFMVDPYQVPEARAAGGDAILLILAALDDGLARELRDEAKRWDLDVLAEVHDEEELERAMRLEPELLGVNNRDLRTFETDIQTTPRLAAKAGGTAIVSESGVDGADAMRTLSAAGIRRFLIGEHLMRASDPGVALEELVKAVDG